MRIWPVFWKNTKIGKKGYKKIRLLPGGFFLHLEVFPMKAGRVGNMPPDSVYFALYAPAALGGIFTQANLTRV